MSIETNMREGMLARMPSGKYQSFLTILKYFTFTEFQEQFNFESSSPPAFKFPWLSMWFNCYIYVE